MCETASNDTGPKSIADWYYSNRSLFEKINHNAIYRCAVAGIFDGFFALSCGHRSPGVDAGADFTDIKFKYIKIIV